MKVSELAISLYPSRRTATHSAVHTTEDGLIPKKVVSEAPFNHHRTATHTKTSTRNVEGIAPIKLNVLVSHKGALFIAIDRKRPHECGAPTERP
jgi:hypothetical protein